MVTHMKTMETTVPVLFVMAMIGCRQQQHERNVTVVRPKEAVGPVETTSDLKGLPTIMQYDLDALQRTPSKEVVYVKPGEPARPSEARR
jgi:hypothetical protein